jgi:hypothetical protein
MLIGFRSLFLFGCKINPLGRVVERRDCNSISVYLDNLNTLWFNWEDNTIDRS